MSQVYRPSFVVNLKVRFDEALTLVVTPDPETVDQRAAAPSLAGAVGGFLGSGVQGAAANAFGAVTGLVEASAVPSTEPLVTKRGEANTTFITNRVPKTMNVELPGYRQAGTFKFTVDYHELPIDPRVVRSAAVEIHLGTVSDDDFAAGMRGVTDGNGRKLSILRTKDANGNPRQDTLVMVGLVDTWEVKHTDTDSTVEITGRDLRSSLIDMKLNTKPGVLDSVLSQIDTSRPIDVVVAQILSYHPGADLYTIVSNPAEWPDGVIPAPLGATTSTRVQKGARGKSSGGKASLPGSSGDMTFWDLITQLCYLCGAIPYFTGYSLRIRPSRSIFDQQRAGFDPAIPTPFVGGKPRTVGTDTFAVRRVVYGRDTMELSFKREFASGARPKTIRCVSIDPSGGKKGAGAVIEGRWPPVNDDPKVKKARTQHVAPSNQNAHEDILNIPVPGVRDAKRLAEIAHSLWNEIGRNEMGGSCATKRKLASFGGDNNDPDLLHLQPGDGVEFLTNVQPLTTKAPVTSTAINYARNSFSAQVKQYVSRGLSEDFARVIVATARGLVLELQRFFRVANVKYDCGPSGIDVTFDFQNYLVVRYDVGDSVGTQPGEVKRTTVVKKSGGPQ